MEEGEGNKANDLYNKIVLLWGLKL